MKRACLLAGFLLLCSALPSEAQFYLSNCEPASVRWSQIRTDNYRVIYPAGLDSLGRAYATALENAVPAVGKTVGFRPNQSYRRPQPVILHPWNTMSNGMVTWTPRRMELNTTPETFAPMPMPWTRELAIHESRHVAQMQYVNAGYFRPLTWLSGQLGAGGLAALYGGPSFFEGDAVAAETALSQTGRGRSAEFLEYYRATAAAGQSRSWYQWRYGSFNRFTPDHYTIGYITAAGVRSVYDKPDFTKLYYTRLFRRFLPVRNFQKTIQEISGKKFRAAFGEICDTLYAAWDRDAALRAPFMTMEQMVAKPAHYTEYMALCSAGDGLLALRDGIAQDTELVRVEADGTIERVMLFSGLVERMRISGFNGNLYWSEPVPDARWKTEYNSEIRYLDAQGTAWTLTRGTRYFNPSPRPDGNELAVVEQCLDGTSAVRVIDALDGTVLRSYKAPEGLQLSEAEWLGGGLYALAVSEDGTGLYRVDEGFRNVLAPAFVTMKELFAREGKLWFTSDLNGVNELYCVLPSDGREFRVTNTPLGASSFSFSPSGDRVYYSVPGVDGRLVNVTPVEDLPVEEVDPKALHEYPFAEELSAGEPLRVGAEEVRMSEPAPYRKWANAVRIHSWLPLYVPFDDLSSLSGETLYMEAGLGATAFFQNDLGSLSGYAGYHLIFAEDGYRNSGQVKFSSRSLPVCLDFKLDVNDRSNRENGIAFDEEAGEDAPYKKDLGKALVVGSVKAYLPLSWHRGGWSTGFIPSATFSFANDCYRISESETVSMDRVTTSLRAYALRSTPSACYYPKFGIGTEFGYGVRPALAQTVSPNFYLSLYGYAPGFTETQGLRLSMLTDIRTRVPAMAEPMVSTTPRGYDAGAFNAMAHHKSQTRFTLDYAIPFAPLEWDFLCPLAYVRNLELLPHADFSVYSTPEFELDGKHYLQANDFLWSAGADFNVVLGNIVCIPYVTRIGVSFSYKGGPSFDTDRDGSHFFFGPVFSVEM